MKIVKIGKKRLIDIEYTFKCKACNTKFILNRKENCWGVMSVICPVCEERVNVNVYGSCLKEKKIYQKINKKVKKVMR